MSEKSFLQDVLRISIPVALQSMLQSSFSMVDQIMVGQLGDKSVAAVEIAGKPSFIYAFVIGAISTITGIMISQYIGNKNREAEEKSICVNFLVMILTGLTFLSVFGLFRNPFVEMFTEEEQVIAEGSTYLGIISWTFIPLGICSILGTALRCRDKSTWPLYIGIFSALLNTGLNYCLIFGNFGAPRLGIAGAAYASVISQAAGALISILCFYRLYGRIRISLSLGKAGYSQYFMMLLPIVLNEFFWSVGQSVYTYVYGHMGTNELAGMSLTGAVQGLTMGALSGLSQAAGILIGKRLGCKEYDAAYEDSKKLCGLGVAGSLVFTLLLILIRNPYVQMFNVSGDVRGIGADILAAFAILMPVKVQNMILGGGIIRSGGKTKYVMMIDMMGTWLIGVPLALLTGLYLKLPVIWVYFILSQEELIRLIVSVFMFRSRKWMHTLQ
ncbi:MAG: MATE family efflux transporter [Porcincola intestinalis]|jgi:putative MATE family efflux protein|uniref:MATE family efflux transporter n=1 Tax=Porcincola intestinalis TaxID=2606632 RepID=UPI0029D8926F|nr:MATE family efflux transporter [Porcincola intestinalis]MCI6238464.1 MATE family efflux transporter [Lachnospiraceae bacterium]MCI6699160.1 MATE family efflux transporter [Lachnospiraceae bacterium]MDY5332475.1 MATE family efflux transporter [Porcincola intestinalis]